MDGVFTLSRGHVVPAQVPSDQLARHFTSRASLRSDGISRPLPRLAPAHQKSADIEMSRGGGGGDRDGARPEPWTSHDSRTTLIFSWFTTSLVLAIIGTRLAGRKIRANAILREDVLMAIAAVPLLARMVLLQLVLDHGTNDVALRPDASGREIRARELGSKMVLATRVFYAMFIWLAKFTASEFLKRVTSAIWNRTYETILHIIRIFLVLAFLGVVIATIAECQPFDHYWQVVPYPERTCRSGFAQLITMGVCDIITDLLLMALPIFLICRSYLPVRQKLSLVVVFSTSIVMVVINAVRVPLIIEHDRSQAYRSAWATAEILAAGVVTNAVVLGSFVRDKGIKRNRYRASIEKSQHIQGVYSISRLPDPQKQARHLDSDEDLFAAIGCRMPEDLKRHFVNESTTAVRPAPPVNTLSLGHSGLISRASTETVRSVLHVSRPAVSAPAISAARGSRPQLIRLDTSEQALHANVPRRGIVVSAADLASLAQSPRIRDAGGLLSDDEHASMEERPATPMDALRNGGLTALRSPRLLLGSFRSSTGAASGSLSATRGRNGVRSRMASPQTGFRELAGDGHAYGFQR